MWYHIKSLEQSSKEALMVVEADAQRGEVPCPRPLIGRDRARNQAQVCLLDSKCLNSSLPLCSTTCCVWHLAPWLCLVLYALIYLIFMEMVPYPSSIQHLFSAYCVPDILESFEVTKINKMMFLTLRSSGLVKEADHCQSGWSVQQQMHMDTEVPERRLHQEMPELYE